MPRLKKAGLIALGVFLFYLFFWPVPVEPHRLEPYRWKPEQDPGLTGPFVPNDDLAAADPVFLNPHGGGTPESITLGTDVFARGPEDVALGPDGWYYSGIHFVEDPDHRHFMRDGAIVRTHPDTGEARSFAFTGGRPLGVEFDAQGNLYVCDAVKGLLRVTPDGTVERVGPDPGSPGNPDYTDNLDIAEDGVVYFSSPSTRWELLDLRYEGMETQPTGRLLSYDPRTDTIREELDGLMFANGVVLGPNDAYVLVAEWYGYSITKKWLKGGKRGKRESFVNNLPGYPDNLSMDDEGTIWVGLVIRRIALVDKLHNHPFLMKILPRIPESLQPQPEPFGWLLGFDDRGRLRYNLQDANLRGMNLEDEAEVNKRFFTRITGAKNVAGELVLTSDLTPKYGRLAVPPPSRY